jgi:hypothetical protein
VKRTNGNGQEPVPDEVRFCSNAILATCRILSEQDQMRDATILTALCEVLAFAIAEMPDPEAGVKITHITVRDFTRFYRDHDDDGD